jgi:hypothetical protein
MQRISQHPHSESFAGKLRDEIDMRCTCLRWRHGLMGGDGAIGLLARGFKSRIMESPARSSLSGANLPAGARSRWGA